MLKNTLFCDPTLGLDADQKAAATSPNGKSMIIAGAGTGKTTTLTARISHLINSGIPASQIVAVTFTNKASRELKERVEQKVGERAEGLRIGTFHGLSSKILRKYAEMARLKRTYTIVDEAEALILMRKASETPGAYGPFIPAFGLDEAELKASKKEWEAGLKDFSEKALRKVTLWKHWGLTESEASDPSRGERSTEDERFAVAYSAYQYELESANYADFGDLIVKVVSLFNEHPRVLHAESELVRHMLVDEAQDANSVQVEWVRLLTSFHGGLTVVGDEDQNIYGFQGGYPGAMEDMTGSNALKFVLKLNRRCTDEILEPANIAVGYNRRKESKVLLSGRRGNPVVSTGHPTDINEAAWIASQISDLIEAGAAPEQISVLFRSKHLIPIYEEAILRKGIPSLVTSGSSLMAREEVKDVMAMVRLAVNPYDELAFQRVALRPSRGLGAAAIEMIVKHVSTHSIPFHAACFAATERGSGLNLRKDAREGAGNLGHALSVLAEQGEWCHHTHDMITICLENTGYVEWLKSQGGGDKRIENIEALLRLAESYEDASEFLEEVSLLTDGESPATSMEGKVRLSTMHSVKGLEFDYVFCPGFDDGVMPNARAVEEGRKGTIGDRWDGPHGGGIEEERRLAHVAFTRARHGLFVSFAWRRGVGRRSKSGGPSSFMEECEFKWKEIGVASSADLGRKKTNKKWSSKVGFNR